MEFGTREKGRERKGPGKVYQENILDTYNYRDVIQYHQPALRISVSPTIYMKVQYNIFAGTHATHRL